MGKIKKGRKGGKGDESDSDVEVESQEQSDNTTSKKSKSQSKAAPVIDGNDGEIAEKPSKKKGKKEKKAVDSDESEVEIEKSKKKTKDKKSTAENDTKVKSKGKKGSVALDDSDQEAVAVSKAQKSFALLQVESDSDSVAETKPELSDSDSKPTKKDSKGKKINKESDERTKDSAKSDKKSKKNRRKRDDSDDDIDKVLAELEMEYSGVKAAPLESNENLNDANEKKDKAKKLDKKADETEINVDEVENVSTVKSAAQKKKEKKERDKQKKAAAKNQEPDKQEVNINEPEQKAETLVADAEDNEKDAKKKKKKGAKGKEEDEDKKDPKKGPGKKTIAAMQEALKKLREEEERLKHEEEERIRLEEEAEQARLEALRLEKERKDKKKLKEKERKERLKAEGKLLTNKQKADRARAQALIDSLKAQGMELPDVGERKLRPGTRVKPSKLNKQKSVENEVVPDKVSVDEPKEEVKIEEAVVEVPVEESDDDVKDAWDAESSDDDESEKIVESAVEKDKKETTKKEETKKVVRKTESDDEETSDDEDEDSDESEDDSEDVSEEEEEHRTDAEKRREKAKARIEQRQLDAEKNRSPDNLRAAVVCVLGHVDTGKTKILDKLRRTNVQDGEAGGITQQIGATNVPIDAIKEQIKNVKGFADMKFKLPGLLIIDTPGHESFSNLRSRGSSLCDIAILVVDIMHGLEPQTIESLNMLKAKKTPFIVALNKIDRLYDWQTMARKDISDIIKAQAANTQLEFEQRKNEVVLQFAEQGLNAALSYENPDERSYVSLVPTSAVTGEGMGNLLSLIVENCQTRLTKRLMYSEELQATVLEVKAIPGLGTTIDAILINGTLREGDTMVLAGTEGPISTQIRSLLMPQPMRELRVKNAYIEYREIKAAQGVKIAAKELEKAIAGLNLYVAQKPDEVEILVDDVAKELKTALSGIKLQERGVYVQASTLGSLEALLEFLKSSKIPYSGIRIGPVVKKDVMKASIMLEHERQYATILAFDVKIERDAQELADTLGVTIFQADIIYHLFDKFMAFREEIKQRKREEFKHIAVFPCKLRILPQFIFNSRDPIVVGVIVEGGIVKEGTPICVPSREFVDVGVVTSIEMNHKNVESARKGMEVCIKIDPIPGESPKMFGRHFDDKDFLISKISRQSIDACKEYFRDDLTKPDWQLMVELKKMFQIM